jgi:hypothetical protein
MVAGVVLRDVDRGVLYFQNVTIHARVRVKVIYLTPKEERGLLYTSLAVFGSITCRFHIPNFTPVGRIAIRSVHSVHEAWLAVPLLS